MPPIGLGVQLGLGGGKSATSSGGGGLFAPVITSSAATNVISNGATLNGTLVSTGGSDPSVTVYWGTTDRGEVTFGWNGGNNPFGTQSAGAISYTISGLAPTTTFYYRFRAANSAGIAWTGVQSFITLADVFSVGVVLPQADILLRTSDTAGTIAYGTDTENFYVFDGSLWFNYPEQQ